MSTSLSQDDQARLYFNVKDDYKFLNACETNFVAPRRLTIGQIWKMAKRVFTNQPQFLNSELFFKAVSSKIKLDLGGSVADFYKILEPIDCATYSLGILDDKEGFVKCINGVFGSNFVADNNLYQNLLDYFLKLKPVLVLLGRNYFKAIRNLAENGYLDTDLNKSKIEVINDFKNNQAAIEEKLISLYKLHGVMGLHFLPIDFPYFIPHFSALTRIVLQLYGRTQIFNLRESQYSTFEPFVGLEKNDINVLGEFFKVRKEYSRRDHRISWFNFEEFFKDLETKKETLIKIFNKQKEFGLCGDDEPMEKKLLEQVKNRMITCCQKQDNKLRSIENLDEKIFRTKEYIVKKILGEDEVKKIEKNNKNKDRIVNLYDTVIKELSETLTKIHATDSTLPILPADRLLKVKEFIDNNEHLKYLEKLDPSYENHTVKSKGILKALEQLLHGLDALNNVEKVNDSLSPNEIEVEDQQPGGSFQRKHLRNKNTKKTKGTRGRRLVKRRRKITIKAKRI